MERSLQGDGAFASLCENRPLFDFSSYEKEKDTGDMSNALIASLLPFLFRSSCVCLKISSCLLEKEQCEESGRIEDPKLRF